MTIALSMVLFGGMDQDFDKTLNEFLDQVKIKFDQYSDFVQYVSDALVSLQNTPPESVPSPKKAVSAKQQTVVATGEKKKILIVDDAEINRVLMGHFFKNMPVTLEYAVSGEQALEKITGINFDLILMDLQMKGMSGLDAIKAIRAAQPQNLKTTQIVAISNQSPTDQERADVMNAGANEYLTKSMSRDAIRERVFEFVFGSNQISA